MKLSSLARNNRSSQEAVEFCCILTTIQPPTFSVRRLVERLSELGGQLIVAGDRKGPAEYPLPGVRLLTLQDQLDGPFELARKLPTGHYVRKNIAYLEAILAGAGVIYETDDDNAPLANWALRSETVEAVPVKTPGWVNVYRFFSPENIWPRGLPLDEIVGESRKQKAESRILEQGESVEIGKQKLENRNAGPKQDAGDQFQISNFKFQLFPFRSPVQQGLVNGSPDVDAIWRLVQDHPFDFETGPSRYLSAGTWCPFNSQSTWWWPVAYPLLYLPSHCTFRMTDIWRSFVAQRCLWAMDMGLTFHAPEVVQERNPHNLMRDFADEVPGYLQNRKIAEILEKLDLRSGPENVAPNLLTCYDSLIQSAIFPKEELALVQSWVEGLAQAQR